MSSNLTASAISTFQAWPHRSKRRLGLDFLELKKTTVLMTSANIKLAVIGLGYVGLPLAVEFGRKRPVIGFDINQRRIDELKSGNDFTLETTPEELSAATKLSFTTSLEDLRTCSCYIVTVPTPIDEYKRPDLPP